MDDDFEKIFKDKKIEEQKRKEEIAEGLKRVNKYFDERRLIYKNIFEEINNKVDNLIHYVSQISEDIKIDKYKFQEMDMSDMEIGMVVIKFETNIKIRDQIELLNTITKKEQINFLISIDEKSYSMLSGEELSRDSVYIKLYRNWYLQNEKKISDFNSFFKQTFKQMLDDLKNPLIKILPKT